MKKQIADLTKRVEELEEKVAAGTTTGIKFNLKVVEEVNYDSIAQQLNRQLGQRIKESNLKSECH